MNNYRYTLDKTSKKYLCPDCGKKRFVRYIDTETNEYLPEKYGMCERIDHCQYFVKPEKVRIQEYKPQPKPKPQPVYFIPEHILKATLKDYEINTFVQNLLKLAPVAEVEKIISHYRLGTIGDKERKGAVTFPFIDRIGNIRTIQAKEFNDTNHTISTDFVHSIIERYLSKDGKVLPDWLVNYKKNELKVSCLFGEHLLNKYPLNPIALVEAPKTAIIATLYYGLPDDPAALLWLAVYNKSSLTIDKCKALQGRKVVLFPDLNAYNEWNAKAKEIQIKIPNTQFFVSDLLETKAQESEKKQGLDLADYLTQFDYYAFRQQAKQFVQPQPQSKPQATTSSDELKITQPVQPENTKKPTNHNHFVAFSTRENIRRDYLGDDGILHIHYPGIPELN